jgi:glycerol-3-phosphate dehydrogenase
VKEALYERSVFLKTAPYLSYELPIMIPLYKYWKVPYYYAGSKAYDMLAGKPFNLTHIKKEEKDCLRRTSSLLERPLNRSLCFLLLV